MRFRWLGAASLVLGLALLVTFALPVRTWRTGELPAPPLPLVPGGPAVSIASRLWIDTDAACGHGRRTDPDDCLALLLLARSRRFELVGISTVAGNGSLDVTDRTTRALAARLTAEGVRLPPVYRGGAEAARAMRTALHSGPLTVLALGPLTNVAAALEGAPEARRRVGRLIAVMGRRPGHVFHPAEGSGQGMLFGHGPVFGDFNVEQDRAAAAFVTSLGLPTTLVPYDASRELLVDSADLAALRGRGGARAWVADRAEGWLDFWRRDAGRPGFAPFDLLAAAYVLDPSRFDCAAVAVWMAVDRRLWHLLPGRPALLAGLEEEQDSSAHVRGHAVYCARARDGLHDLLTAELQR